MTSDSDFIHVKWCNFCNAEPAVSSVEIEIFNQVREMDIGQECLTRAQEAGKMD